MARWARGRDGRTVLLMTLSACCDLLFTGIIIEGSLFLWGGGGEETYLM